MNICIQIQAARSQVHQLHPRSDSPCEHIIFITESSFSFECRDAAAHSQWKELIFYDDKFYSIWNETMFTCCVCFQRKLVSRSFHFGSAEPTKNTHIFFFRRCRFHFPLFGSFSFSSVFIYFKNPSKHFYELQLSTDIVQFRFSASLRR